VPTNFGFVIRDGGVDARGELDLASVSTLRAVLAAFDGHVFDLDLGAVTFIDSTGVGALIAARRHHEALRITNPSAAVLAVFETAGVTGLLVYTRNANGT
jgi:anti-anti-sigma factor